MAPSLIYAVGAVAPSLIYAVGRRAATASIIFSFFAGTREGGRTRSVATATDCTCAFSRQNRVGTPSSLGSTKQKCSHEMDGPTSLTVADSLPVKSADQC